MTTKPNGEHRTQEFRAEHFNSPSVLVKDGTYGLENDPSFYWIRNENLTFLIVNPTSKYLRADVRISLGPSPCHTPTELVSIRGDGKSDLISSLDRTMIHYTVKVFSRSQKTVSLKVRGTSCRVPSDPRVFLGSIQSIGLNYEIESST